MEKLKDFIYDKNDILVALGVLLLAAFLIVWRMDAIMDYPEKIFADGEQISAEQGSDEGQDDADGSAGSDENPDSGDTPQPDDSGSSDTPAVPSDALWQGGILTRDVEVDVYGNSAMAAVQCLVDAGLFDDYEEYKIICDLSGMNHEKVSAGSLLFEKGCTKEEVARKINWS